MALARAMQVKPNGVKRVEVSRDWLAQLRREDTKAIWEAVGEDVNMWYEPSQRACLFKKPGSWAKLEQILDMPKDVKM